METVEIKGTTKRKHLFGSESEWLSFRKNYIGASDASIITGDSKWKTTDGRIKTARLLWEEKLGLTDLDTNTAATRFGRSMENPAREAYQQLIGELVAPVCITNEKYPHLLASLDGLNVTEDRAVEIKNCNEEDHRLASNGEIPAKYYPQVQVQAMVAELPFVDYFSFHKGEGIIVKVERDEKYLEKMLKKLNAFWECVQTLTEPPLGKYDYVERGEDWLECAKKLYGVKETIRLHKKEEEALSKMLRKMSDERPSCFGGLRYACSESKGLVDYTSIPELSGVDLETYRKPPIKRWTLSVDKKTCD